MTFKSSHIVKLLISSIFISILNACSSVGSIAISNGRLNYNNAIITTENQQILMVAIHNRYEERLHLLSVASITANVNITTQAGIQMGSGSESDYAGNLVPFRVGVIYEENPTISYVPVGGEQYSEQLFSPISVEILLQLASNLNHPKMVYLSLLSNINGLRNPNFLLPKMKNDPRFLRLITIMGQLTQAERLHWVSNNQRNRLFLSLDRSDDLFKDETNEMLKLLGLSNIKTSTQPLMIPVATNSYVPGENIISLKTRSVWTMIELLSSAIQLPNNNQQNHSAATYLNKGLSAKLLKVHASKEKPSNAYVSVEHNDHWFYINNTDHSTKRFFRLLGDLMYATMADSVSGSSAAPILTVPVSG